MTPEEKFNKDVWCVLKQIKERSLYTRKGDSVSYKVYFNFVAGGYPSSEDEVTILEKLDEEWGAIHMLRQYGTAEYDRVFCIEIIEPTFEEIYKKYQKLANENLKIQVTSKGAEILTDDEFPIDTTLPETDKPVAAESKPEPKIRENKAVSERPRRTKPEIKNSQYLSDNLLFLIWRILKIDNKPNGWEYLFMHIQPVGWDNKKTIDCLFDLESQFGIRLQNPRFELECFKDGHEDDYQKIVDLTRRQAQEKPWQEPELALFGESMEECFLIREKLLDNEPVDMKEVRTLLLDMVPVDIKSSILEGVWFEVRVAEGPRKKLADLLDEYLNNFINNTLSGNVQGESSLTRPQNFFTFECHKKLSLTKLEELQSNYGDRFLLSGKLYESEEFLHIHFLLALEKLGYIKINRLGMNSGAYTHGDDPEYEAVIILQPSFNSLTATETTEEQQPAQKIEIVNKEFVVRNAGDNTPTKGKKRESPIELSFPEPVQWEKVELKIKESEQEIEILYDNGHIITADYIRLGFFSGKKQQKPDRRWGFLCALATLAATDIKQATAENMRRMITQGKILSANNVQQVKRSFVEQLQKIFKTRDDPFQDNRTYYEPKFTILPEPSLRRENPWPQGGRLNENRGDETDRLAYEEKRIQEDSEEEAL